MRPGVHHARAVVRLPLRQDGAGDVLAAKGEVMNRRTLLSAIISVPALALARFVKPAKPPAPDGSTIASIIASDSRPFSDDEMREDLKFFSGKHWPDDALAARAAAGRPCLVFDLIGPVVAIAANNSLLRGERFTDKEHDHAIAICVRRGRDSNMAYDYLRSRALEIQLEIKGKQ